MSELRNKVIRLAHSNPKLRKHLLPLLKQSSQRWTNKTVAKNMLINDHARNTILTYIAHEKSRGRVEIEPHTEKIYEKYKKDGIDFIKVEKEVENLLSAIRIHVLKNYEKKIQEDWFILNEIRGSRELKSLLDAL